MTARAPARRLALNVARVLLGAAALSGLSPACFSGAGGTNPPQRSFYFPVGLAVSSGGNVLYAVNSDFDLQWNGGTLQSYDLFHLRHDVAELINANANVAGATVSGIQFIPPAGWQKNCRQSPPLHNADGSRVPLGQACSPPVDSTQYIGQSVTIGAFATDLQLSRNPSQPRLFSPVRGDTTLTWADVPQDDADAIPARDMALAAGAMQGSVLGNTLFDISCGAGTDSRCDTQHQTGQSLTGDNTRMATLPGEPFAMAQTEDGTAIAITHQTGGNTSLLLTGLPPTLEVTQPPMGDGGVGAQPDASALASGPPMPSSGAGPRQPSMQFVLTGVPLGGDGIAAVPHDLYAPIKPCEWVNDQAPCVRPAFLQTTRSAAELDLLRYYDDFGSSLHRPFLVKEAAYALTANAGGTDSRGIVIDPTPRLACKGRPPQAGEGFEAHLARCAQLPARVFFASRTPPSLVIGEIGEPSASGDGTYDPDRLVIRGNVPLSFGPSKVYLAPIVDRTGHYALRVFIVCFDSAQIFVYDPDAAVVENVISVGPGPFAMAFDPFDWGQVFGQGPPPLVQDDGRYDPGLHLKRYRFAYVASFTQSFVQVLDLDDSIHLDDSIPNGSTTFETVVFTLGQPTAPKGS